MQRGYICNILEEHEAQDTVQRRASSLDSDVDQSSRPVGTAAIDRTPRAAGSARRTSNTTSRKRRQSARKEALIDRSDDDSSDDDIPLRLMKRSKRTIQKPEARPPSTSSDSDSEVEIISTNPVQVDPLMANHIQVAPKIEPGFPALNTSLFNTNQASSPHTNGVTAQPLTEYAM